MNFISRFFKKRPKKITWPNDPIGDVFRRLKMHNFDFSKAHNVDYNIKLESWPPPNELLVLLKTKYSDIELIKPSDDFEGYIQVTITQMLTYENVLNNMNEMNDFANVYGGVCNSWGVMG